jgi:hypothetical protein
MESSKFRTKNSATEIITIAPGTSANVDLILSEERYTHGGEIICENAEFGDYFYAEVCDSLSLIPEAYRAALCDNWPTVVRYIDKRLMVSQGQGKVSFSDINTEPRIAKITAGLSLRVHYVAVASGIDRKVCVNYNLIKKM